MSEDDRQIYLSEDDYHFRTVYSNLEFNEGIHYWEIIGDSRCEHELKIGVSAKKLMH
jgi:hypothetical protein